MSNKQLEDMLTKLGADMDRAVAELVDILMEGDIVCFGETLKHMADRIAVARKSRHEDLRIIGAFADIGLLRVAEEAWRKRSGNA